MRLNKTAVKEDLLLPTQTSTHRPLVVRYYWGVSRALFWMDLGTLGQNWPLLAKGGNKQTFKFNQVQLKQIDNMTSFRL